MKGCVLGHCSFRPWLMVVVYLHVRDKMYAVGDSLTENQGLWHHYECLPNNDSLFMYSVICFAFNWRVVGKTEGGRQKAGENYWSRSSGGGGYLEMSLHVSCLKPIPYRNARPYLFNRSSMFYSARSPVLDPEGGHEGDRHSSLVHLLTRRYYRFFCNRFCFYYSLFQVGQVPLALQVVLWRRLEACG